MATIERNLLELRSRVTALERVIASLIATHPDKLAFASNLEKAAEVVTSMHLNDEAVSDEVREHQRQIALEFAQLARDYVRRANPPPPPDAPPRLDR